MHQFIIIYLINLFKNVEINFEIQKNYMGKWGIIKFWNFCKYPKYIFKAKSQKQSYKNYTSMYMKRKTGKLIYYIFYIVREIL